MSDGTVSLTVTGERLTSTLVATGTKLPVSKQCKLKYLENAPIIRKGPYVRSRMYAFCAEVPNLNI